MSRVRTALFLVASTVLAGTVAVSLAEPAAATTAPAPPAPSRSHYLRNLTNGDDPNDELAMYGLGCIDAESGSREVVLDVGAQTIHAPLSIFNPGVALTATDPVARVTYTTLVAMLKRYVDGYRLCGSNDVRTLAVATNSDGEFNTYTATTKGQHWADRVIDPLRSYVTAKAYGGIAVIGAIDIEAGFAASLRQASQWESSYLANTTVNLHYIGSADGCPNTRGVTGKACNRGWTQQQYYNLTTKLGRVRALPQIYVSGQATQWQNIDATGGKRIVFAGSLSEHAACPTSGPGCPTGGSFTPATAWTALWTALNRIGETPLRVATDLDIVPPLSF